MKGFIGFGKFLSAVAMFGLFFGVLSGMAVNTLRIIYSPFSADTWKLVITDTAKIIANSQGELSKTVKEFPEIVESGFGDLAIARIFGCSLITLSMIYLVYKPLRKLVPSPNTSTLLLLVIISVVVVWFIGVIASFISGNTNWVPYKGFIDLVRYRKNIIEYLLSEYHA